jgi:aldehyde dehydrogenase (NAD+)
MFSTKLWQVDELEDCFELINSRPKPLAAYLFSRNKKLEEEFVQNVSAGGILINDAVIHVSRFYSPMTI